MASSNLSCIPRGTAILFLLLCLSAESVLAAGPSRGALSREGDPIRGRGIFNGLGDCYKCHGYDAFMSRRPTQPPKLARELGRLAPPNLRDPAQVKAQTAKDRLRAIDSHRGTRLLPKKFLTERERADLLAYLETLTPLSKGPGRLSR